MISSKAFRCKHKLSSFSIFSAVIPTIQNSKRHFHFSSSNSTSSQHHQSSAQHQNFFSSTSSGTIPTNKNSQSNIKQNVTIVSQDELAMMDVEELTRELGRFGWHSPNPAHLRLVVGEMLSRGAMISAKTIREAIKLCHLSQDRKTLYPLAIELFLNRTYGATENDMRMLGLPEELIDCAALCEVGDPLQKMTLICRSAEHTLRTAHSVDVVSGLEMSLFRALWRCFVILKQLRFSGVLNRNLEERRSGEELEVLEAARRIFDLLSIVNKKMIPLLLLLSSSNTNLNSNANNNSNNSNNNSGTSFTSADENLAFKSLCRLISLRVMYSSSSSSSNSKMGANDKGNINSNNNNNVSGGGGDYFSDDGEAEYFRLVFSRNWLHADVSGSPAARYLSLMKTCENGMRHDVATEYFEQYEMNHPFLVKKMQGFTTGGDHNSDHSQVSNGSDNNDDGNNNVREEKLFLSFQVEQFELVLKNYWNLLIICGEHEKVVQVLVKYLDIFDKYNHQLPASILSVAMRSVGELKKSNIAARTMGNLFKSFSSGMTKSNESSNANSMSTNNTIIDQHSSSSSTISTSSNFRPPTQYEMLTCLSALAKCGHPSFQQALETCIQENLIDATSAAAPLRLAELRLMYALNDPIDSLSLVQSEITRCEDAGCSIKSDFRCAGLILQILLRIDEDSFLSVFQDIVVLEKKQNNNKSSISGIQDIPSAWVDWLVVWALRRRYELNQVERQYILNVIDKKRAPSYFVAPQAEIIRFDFDKENETQQHQEEKHNQINRGGNDQQVVTQHFSDPRCVWPKRRTALTSLIIQRNGKNDEWCIAESIMSLPYSGVSSCILGDKVSGNNSQKKLQAMGDVSSMFKRLGEF